MAAGTAFLNDQGKHFIVKELERLKVNVGEKVRRIRELAGITREEFAKRLGVSVHAVESLETHIASIGRQPLVRIARALEISVDDIERFTEETDSLDGLVSYRNRVVNGRTDKEYYSLTDRVIKKYDDLLSAERARNLKLQHSIRALKKEIARLERLAGRPS